MEKKIKEKAEEAEQEAQEVIEEIAEQPKKSLFKSKTFWIAVGVLVTGLGCFAGWKAYNNRGAEEPKMIEDEPTPVREYGNGNQNYNNKRK